MISSAIDYFNTPVMVTRVDEVVEFVDGVAQPVTKWDEFEMTGCTFKPWNPRERMLLPELIRDRELSLLYTKCWLRSVDVAGKLRADRITYREERYVVASVEDWAPHGAYYKAVLMKENDG